MSHSTSSQTRRLGRGRRGSRSRARRRHRRFWWRGGTESLLDLGGCPFAPGQRESERASQLSSPNRLDSQAFAFPGQRERANPSRREPREGVRSQLRMRSHFSLVANRRRGSVNRSPQGAIRGGFAVSPQNSEPFARCACRDGALAGARRERRASAMSAAWDSSPALSPVPWGERNGEAFNCVPGG